MRILASLLLLPSLAAAQYIGTAKCLPAPFNIPYPDTPVAVASTLEFAYNSVGVCVRWYCFEEGFPTTNPNGVQRNTYCGSWAEQSKVGSRIQTIQKALDPLKSLNDAGKRFPMTSLSDPSMSGMPMTFSPPDSPSPN